MNGQEIDRHAVWAKLDRLLEHEAAMPRAADLAAAMQLAAEAAERGHEVPGGEEGLSRLAANVSSLMRAAKADLEAMRAEFARPAA